MRAPITFLVAAVALSACHRAPAPPNRVVPSRVGSTSDTAFLRLCASPPETTSTGSVGCVMRDQSRRLPVKKDPKR
jgi:hypothetical protein